MVHEEYGAILLRCGTLEELSAKERWRLMQDWRHAFAGSLHARTGKWVRGEFDWHVFSFGDAAALKGARALEAYRAEGPGTVLVIPQAERLPGVRLHAHHLPELRGLDVYISPPDFSWTMAFTHEESAGLGPYFSHR